MKATQSQIIDMMTIANLDSAKRREEYAAGHIISALDKNSFPELKAYWPEAEYFSFANITGWIGERNGCLAISLRGSDSVWDWIRNLMLSKKVIPYEGTNPGIKAHTGFLKNYKAIREFIHYKVLNSELTSVLIYGHSMAASVSALMALDIQYNFPEVEIIAFGSGTPPTGNKAFKESFEHRIPDYVRYNRASDLIPNLVTVFPNQLGFAQIGEEVLLNPPKKGLGSMANHPGGLYLADLKKLWAKDL